MRVAENVIFIIRNEIDNLSEQRASENFVQPNYHSKILTKEEKVVRYLVSIANKGINKFRVCGAEGDLTYNIFVGHRDHVWVDTSRINQLIWTVCIDKYFRSTIYSPVYWEKLVSSIKFPDIEDGEIKHEAKG